ncbi:hypothetical protein DL770_000721 [Monosporascus sp. CRB-9-2]|nr:hypothetical protein DL770_000721 [Monosporascus sp. CRB-9-2]
MAPKGYKKDEKSNEKRVNRPMNCFMLFHQSRAAAVKAANPNLKNGDISRVISREWAETPEIDKDFWRCLTAEKADVQIYYGESHGGVYSHIQPHGRQCPASQGSWLFNAPVNRSSAPWYSYSPGAMDNLGMPYGGSPADLGGNPSYAPLGNHFCGFTRGIFLPQGHGGNNNSSRVSYPPSTFANILNGFSETYPDSLFLNHDTIVPVAHPDNAARQVPGRHPNNSSDDSYFAQASDNIGLIPQWPTDFPVFESSTEVSRNLTADTSQDVVGSVLGVSGSTKILFTAMDHHPQRQAAQHQASQAQTTQDSGQLNLMLPVDYGNISHELSQMHMEAFHMNGAMTVPLAHQHRVFQESGDNGIPSLPTDQIIQNQVVQDPAMQNRTVRGQDQKRKKEFDDDKKTLQAMNKLLADHLRLQKSINDEKTLEAINKHLVDYLRLKKLTKDNVLYP